MYRGIFLINFSLGETQFSFQKALLIRLPRLHLLIGSIYMFRMYVLLLKIYYTHTHTHTHTYSRGVRVHSFKLYLDVCTTDHP